MALEGIPRFLAIFISCSDALSGNSLFRKLIITDITLSLAAADEIENLAYFDS